MLGEIQDRASLRRRPYKYRESQAPMRKIFWIGSSVVLVSTLLLSMIFWGDLNRSTALAQQPPTRQQRTRSVTVTIPAVQMPTVGFLTPQATLQRPSLDSNAIQATASAFASGLQSIPGVTAIPSGTLAALSEFGSVAYDSANQSVTVNVTLTEAMINTAFTEAMAAVGYPGATIDLVNGGAVITIPNVTLSAQFSGTLVVTVALTVVDGGVEMGLVSASINGVNVPVALVEDLIATLETTLETALTDVVAGYVGMSSVTVGYSIDGLWISDTAITATVTLYWDTAVTVTADRPAGRPTRSR